MPQTVVITGGTGGIGYQSALGIAKSDSSVTIVVTGRNLKRGEAAVERLKEESQNSNIKLAIGDVSSIAEVDALASEIGKQVNEIDVLINNAGYLGDEMKTNEDNLELSFAINVVAPYRLAQRLLPLLEKGKEGSGKPSRVINVTGGDKPAAVDLDNLQAEKGFKGIVTYTHSKSILEALTVGMAKEFEPKGVLVNVVFPGRASTAMTQALSSKTLPGVMKLFYPFMKLLFRKDRGESAAKAAKSSIWGATSPDLEGVYGKYFDTNCKETPLHKTTADPDAQEKILNAVKAALPN
ncbi:MAG: hypothetical protein SGBAC_007104 [Bacillariaceae sp.]